MGTTEGDANFVIHLRQAGDQDVGGPGPRGPMTRPMGTRTAVDLGTRTLGPVPSFGTRLGDQVARRVLITTPASRLVAKQNRSMPKFMVTPNHLTTDPTSFATCYRPRLASSNPLIDLAAAYAGSFVLSLLFSSHVS